MNFFYRSILLMGLALIAFNANAQFKIGIKTGGNVCNMKFDVDRDYGDEPETKAKMGFHIGIITDITLIKETLSLQPAMLYSNKGYSLDMEKMLDDEFDDEGMDMDDYEGYARFNYNYIEMPVNIVYKYQGFQVSAGPYVAVGMWGTFRHDFSFEVDGEDFDSDDFFDEDSYQLKPVFGKVDDDMFEDYLDDDDVWDLYRAIDFGINLGIGYQVNKVLFNVGYSFGISNLTPYYDADDYDIDDDFTKGYIQKNRVFTFSVSYFFM